MAQTDLNFRIYQEVQFQHQQMSLIGHIFLISCFHGIGVKYLSKTAQTESGVPKRGGIASDLRLVHSDITVLSGVLKGVLRSMTSIMGSFLCMSGTKWFGLKSRAVRGVCI